MLSVNASSLKNDDVCFGKLFNTDLRVKAYLYQGDEDEVSFPLRATVYLLPHSITDILKSKGFAPEDDTGQKILDNEAFLDAIAIAFAGKDDENSLLSLLILDALNENKLIKFTTDKDGSGKMVVTTGGCYLFALAENESEVFVWHQPLDLWSPTQIIELDQYNTEASAEKE